MRDPDLRLPPMADPAAQETPADREELARLLADPRWEGRALPLPAVEGLLCALALGPDEDVPTAQWLPAVLDVDDDEAAACPPALVAALEAMAEDVRVRTAAGTFAPTLGELRRGRADHATWCRGFLEGVDLAPSDWYRSADPEEVEELLFPIRVAGDALSDDEKRAYRPTEWRRLLLDCEAKLPEAIRRLADYWSIVRNPVATFRRDAAKVGRNDPCPCGSGRKFKQCHGR